MHSDRVLANHRRCFSRRMIPVSSQVSNCSLTAAEPRSNRIPQAEFAPETAEFAGAHGKFWEMHDLLFEGQNGLCAELFQELAKRLNLASADLLTALEKREFLARVRADFAGGVRSGVNGTPAFFVDGKRHDAPFEHVDLVAAIEAVLQSK